MALCVSFASRAAKSPADCRRAILVPCPDHSERNSERFCLAARCLRARVRLFCQGMGRMFSGVDSTSVIKRFTMPRAGRVFMGCEECFAISLGNSRFLAQQECRTELYGAGSQSEGGGDAASVHDSAGSDHRNLHGIDNLRNQRNCAHHSRFETSLERPPMTSGFAALGHDRVHSGLRERNRLLDGS
jgi:hypothetical protein